MIQALQKHDARAEGLLDSAMDSLPSAVLLFDRAFTTLYQNQAARRIFSDGPSVAAAIEAISLEGPGENWSDRLRNVIETGTPCSTDLAARLGRDQPETYLAISISPLRETLTGQTIGGVLIAEDISGRIGMERRLAVSERMAAVGKLAARVAHELNNPLDGILRFANLAVRRIAEDGQTDPKLAEYLEHVRSGILRMRDIVSSLLEFSRSGSHGADQATLNKLVEDAVTALEYRAQESHVSVVCNFLQKDMPVVRGSSLFQVFCNLIKNAIDAMPDGGTLTVTTQTAGPDVVICFEDTGTGLPEDVEKIFEPFFTTKPPGKGTGLGLAVCRELIEKYAGTISAKSRQPKGSAFVVRIPLRNCSAESRGKQVAGKRQGEPS